MLDRLSHRLLTLLQLTRMALVFTAISNSLCTLLLALRRDTPAGSDLFLLLDWRLMLLAALVSIGLYGFGMSLNDIIDRRRDEQLAAHRPLPSGRIGLVTAHVICIALGLLAIAACALYSNLAAAGWTCFILLVWTGMSIAFYDFAGKYLVGIGLLALGFIRFWHALIPSPQPPAILASPDPVHACHDPLGRGLCVGREAPAADQAALVGRARRRGFGRCHRAPAGLVVVGS